MSYEFSPPPPNTESLPDYLETEFQKIAIALRESQKYTSEQFLLSTSFVNRRGKSEGVPVWDSTSKAPVWPVGDAPTADWIYGDRTVAYSPK